MNNKPINSAIIAVGGLELSLDEANLFKKYNPLGVSLFARNVKDKLQLKKLVDDIKNAINRDDVLIAVDQEGGRVRRLAEPVWHPYAAQITLGQLDAKASSYHATLIARDLHEMGINLNYAPVLDVRVEQTSLALRSRCLSDDNNVVTKLGKIMVDEYIKNGICPCIKHLPGIGSFHVDPHLGLPVLDKSKEELNFDLYSFQKLSYAPCGMTGHFIVPWLDDKNPITQSKKDIDVLIRGEIGFDGLLISDALDMKALNGTFGERAAKAFAAGCDATCMYSENINEMSDVCANAPALKGKSLERFEKVKDVFKNKQASLDWSKVEAQYDAIIGSVEAYHEEYDATEVLKRMRDKEK